MAAEIFVPDAPSSDDREAIWQRLLAHNETKVGDARSQPLALLLHDDSGASVGGLWGTFYYEWLFVELLFVPEHLRGQGWGNRLLTQAEAAAQRRHCTGLWLDTFSFQAPGFYEKQGYRCFGRLDNYPGTASRFFFQKLLQGGTPDER